MNKDMVQAMFWGYELIASDACADKVQARRHRKKRINKKWRKRYGMKSVPWRKVFITADRKIIGHPSMIDALIVEMKMRKEA